MFTLERDSEIFVRSQSTLVVPVCESVVRPLSTLTIGGVKIEMPVKPYPSQIAMMDKVIRGCQRRQNCLLESPTGSGKTLALLCSALSWQRVEKERLGKLCEEEFQQKILEWQQKEQQRKQKIEKKVNKLKQSEKKTTPEIPVSPVKNKGWSTTPAAGTVITIRSDGDDTDDEMSVFKQPGKKRKMNKNLSNDKMMFNDDSIMTDDSSFNNSSLITDDEDNESNDSNIMKSEINPMPKKPKLVVPKIYFCTRTHKQIDQVIKELQRTNYDDVKSCVLASREHTCIQDSRILYPDITYKTKTELCRDLMDPKARQRNSLKFRRDIEKCSYYDNGGVKISTYGLLNKSGVGSVWDIEEIVRLGKSKGSCPYYGSRNLSKNADIVFCPYNYIIDPVIRGTMNMNLKGHVIIVDEAHNIEDQCRDAASLQLDQTNLNLAKMDCEKLSKYGHNSAVYGALARYMSELSKWIDQKSNDIKSYDDYDRGVISWSGTFTIDSLTEHGIGVKEFEKFKKYCEIVCDDQSEEKEPDEKSEENKLRVLQMDDTDESDLSQLSGKDNIDENPNSEISHDLAITNATKTLLTSICAVFCLFFDNSYKNDYHVSLEKVMQLKQYEHGSRAMTGLDGWINASTETKDTRPVWKNTVSFLCLNPAAMFCELQESARSIILTSGTLSPMQSFQSELGTQFPISLEAGHVIKPNQCMVTSVGNGPAGIDLNSQYTNVNTYNYQDEMGRVLLNVCETVPYGVLCFMPSYMMMDKLYARWQITGLLRELDQHKVVMCEPRRADQLEESMEKYYGAIRRALKPKSKGRTGALFLAVYRGKISEGLDFSDNNARAVVAVGIPFPNYKEVSVTHKKDYNQRLHKDKGLLPGWEWYQIQAYRALNQALGRCIRHRNDWGAILLVDSRFMQAKNLSGLSKWIRGRVEHNNSWSSTVTKLKSFIETRQQEDLNTN